MDPSFRTVVLAHLDTAYNLALWLTGSHRDAEEVVQKSVLSAFRASDRSGKSNTRARWLLIVRKTADSWLSENRPVPVAEVPDIADMAVAEEQREMRGAIAALPVPFRVTLVLRDIEGLDYREIADVTEVSIGTVMSRLAWAREQLVATLS